MKYKTLTTAQRAALPNSSSTYTRAGAQGDLIAPHKQDAPSFERVAELFREVSHIGAENYLSSASWRIPEILKASNRTNKNAAAAIVFWNALGHTQAQGLAKWKKWTDAQKEEIASVIDSHLDAELENLETNF